tara:strand:- start:77 stop:316 length:240 start_codon:yes stop_codon:yes gene_type:complete
MFHPADIYAGVARDCEEDIYALHAEEAGYQEAMIYTRWAAATYWGAMIYTSVGRSHVVIAEREKKAEEVTRGTGKVSNR